MREIENMNDMTEGETLVLRHLARFPDDPLASSDFASVATVQSGRAEWALPILKRLMVHGLCDRTHLRLGNASTWRITQKGINLLQDHPENHPPTSFSGP